MATSSRKPTITSQQQRQQQQAQARRGQADSDAGEQQVRQLLSDIRLLESSARVLQSRLDIISAALSETLTAVQTLEGSREANEGTESLIPIGSGSFVKARLAEPQKAIIGIGAGVCIEKTTDESIKELRVRSSELEKARGTITNQLEQVLGQTEAYRGRLSDLVRRRGGGLEVVCEIRGHFSNLYDKITKSELRGKDLDKGLDEVHMKLLESDVALPAADYIRDQLRLRIEQLEFTRFSDPRGHVRGILQDILLSVLEKPGQVDFFRLVEEKKKKGEQLIVDFVGVNGTGKTTSIAKLSHILQKKRYSVILAASDTYRAGSIQQLEEHARRIGVKTIKHDYGADAAAVAFDAVNYARAHGVNVVLIDTHGRNQTDTQ